MSISNYGENYLLDRLFTLKTVYVGYGDGAAEDVFTEFSGNGYARKAFGAWTLTSVALDVQFVQNDSAITFDIATGTQGTMSHVGFFDAVSGGNFLGSVSLAELAQSDIPVVAGTTIEFPAGDCRMYLD